MINVTPESKEINMTVSLNSMCKMCAYLAMESPTSIKHINDILLIKLNPNLSF